MIMAKEQALLKAHETFARLIERVEQATAEGRRVDEVERELFAGLLEAGCELLGAFIAGHGDGDDGATIEHNEQTLHRQEEPATRRYVSIFGELSIERYVYARRAKQKAVAPLDARLGLPAGEFSYVMEDWLQRLCVKEAFAESCTSLADLLGVRVSVRSAEHMNRQAAEFVAGFRAEQPAPPPDEEGEVLVATFDGKGVPMRRPPQEQNFESASKRRKRGEKANKKQMACVAGVYSIDRFVRTPDEVVDDVLRRKKASQRPEPQNKRLWADLTQTIEGETYSGRCMTVVSGAVEIIQRDPQDQKPIVCVTDGEAALIEEARQWLPERTVHVLDIMHVLERLWKAAYCFHAEGSRAAEEFVAHRLRMLLQGRVGGVIGGLRRMATVHGLTGAKLDALEAVIGYYENHRDMMRYDEYLTAGYPIGSGVVEGACRHLVKDRMERTGMRWTVAGAAAMLHLRATYLNGDWESFHARRIQAEQKALYGAHAA